MEVQVNIQLERESLDLIDDHVWKTTMCGVMHGVSPDNPDI